MERGSSPLEPTSGHVPADKHGTSSAGAQDSARGWRRRAEGFRSEEGIRRAFQGFKRDLESLKSAVKTGLEAGSDLRTIIEN